MFKPKLQKSVPANNSHLKVLYLILVHYCIQLTSAPTAPRNVTLREITSTYAIIQWEQPEFPNGVIRNYTLSLTTTDGTETNITTDQLMINITGLDPFTWYWIVVYAETVAVGEGSSNFSIRTLQDSKQKWNVMLFIQYVYVLCKRGGTP